MEKKTVRVGAWQGDLMVLRVDALPEGVEKQEPVAGQHVIAHSETGHNHTVAADGMLYYADPNNPFVAYLVQESVTSFDAVHHRDHHTHGTLQMLGDVGSVWQIRRQREHTPEGLRRVED